jgi:hypothetical protein
VSILLAFGIQAWWTQVQERQQAAGYVERLTLDIESDTANWREQAEGFALKQERLEQVLEWLRSPSSGDLNEPELLNDLLQAGSHTYGGVAFRTRRAAFDELISTGSLRLLSPSLRRALLEYYAEVAFYGSVVAERDTDYAKRILELVPRDRGYFEARADLSQTERRRIAQRLRSADLESLALAELNRSFLHEQGVESVRTQADTLLSLLQVRLD